MLRIFIAAVVSFATTLVAAQELQPAFVLQLPESVDSVFIADTGDATIYHFERGDTGLQASHEGYMSIGQLGVGKEKAWDRRTPLGIYFVVDQLDTSRLHEKYGVTAFPLDYPNTWDRRLERTGDGIWVHGVLPGGGQRPERDTDGCIALPNEDLERLQDAFVPLATPVIVTRKMRWEDSATIAELRTQLTAAVAAWAGAYGNADSHAYLSLYDDEFRYRGMTLSEWASFRLRVFETRGKVELTVDELLLIADPEEEGLYLSRFEETTSGPDGRSRNIKRLYWRQNDASEWRIVAEDNG